METTIEFDAHRQMLREISLSRRDLCVNCRQPVCPHCRMATEKLPLVGEIEEGIIEVVVNSAGVPCCSCCGRDQAYIKPRFRRKYEWS
jgi:hypothetical protein